MPLIPTPFRRIILFAAFAIYTCGAEVFAQGAVPVKVAPPSGPKEKAQTVPKTAIPAAENTPSSLPLHIGEEKPAQPGSGLLLTSALLKDYLTRDWTRQTVPGLPTDFSPRFHVPALPPTALPEIKPDKSGAGLPPPAQPSQQAPPPPLSLEAAIAMELTKPLAQDPDVIKAVKEAFLARMKMESSQLAIQIERDAKLSASTAELSVTELKYHLAALQRNDANAIRHDDRDAKFEALQIAGFTENGKVTRVVFWAVHIMLTGALLASAVEFYQASRTRKRAEAAKQEFQAGIDGIAVKTTLHGVLLLLIAMAFYFLYLKFVYPVTAVQVDGG